MEVDKLKITIKTDADEKKFIERLKDGEYEINDDCEKIWNVFRTNG